MPSTVPCTVYASVMSTKQDKEGENAFEQGGGLARKSHAPWIKGE